MKATSNQSAVEKNITLVALENIQPNTYNPRKHFDEASLNELAESIRQQGILQPITVRPIADTDRYEIVFGERRYRASVIAEMKHIPVIISELSNEEAEEISVTENLQRKDVTPMEEANAYQRLIESGRHTIQTLAQLFGKGENYIRTRLKFTALIPEIASLLETDEISISVAAEICRYGETIQQEVYEKHLREDVTYNSWRGLKATDIARRIEQNFTTDLSLYHFDKTVCASCPHNTNNLLLFNEGGCGHCANRTCLAEMNTSYLVAKAVQIIQDQPTVSLCQNKYNSNKDVTEQLIALGYEVKTLDWCTSFPNCPKEPLAESFNNTEDYEEAHKKYEQKWAEYEERCATINQRIENGEISVYAQIEVKDITFCYTEKTSEEKTDETAMLSPIEKLEKQDKRNKEIALEKTVEDTKKQILNADITESKFSADEEKMLYFFLLSSLRKEHFPLVGITEEHIGYLTDEDKANIVANLTAKMKNIIRRDFLIANFKNAYGKNTVASLLLDFARKHMPEELVSIENGYNEVYEKRHLRIEEKKAALSTQENPLNENAEQPEEQAA